MTSCFAAPPKSTELTANNYREWIEYIRPSGDEVKWQDIAWRNKMMPAVKEAKKLDRPILLWAMNVNPCGETWNNGVTQRMVVWSDPHVQKLAKEFVCTTEEVDILFPRNEWLINHLKDDPAVHLFRDVYGKQAPRKNWDPSPTKTKQGVYAMMADGTYLSGRFVGTRTDQVLDLMNEALDKWKPLVQERSLRPKPVPQLEALSAWKEEKRDELGLHIEVHFRDLPRKGTKQTSHGKKIGEHYNTAWLELTKAEAQSLVPKGSNWQDVSKDVRDKLFTKGLKDIVYGQSPSWKSHDVRTASLKVRQGKKNRSGTIIELAGDFDLKDNSHQYSGKILGKMLYSPEEKRITHMEVVATGSRSGGTTYNFRNGDEAPAPLGVSFYVK